MLLTCPLVSPVQTNTAYALADGRVVVETETEFRFGSFHWLPRPELTMSGHALDRLPRSSIIEAALDAPSVQGFVGWARFPCAQVEELGDGHRVRLIDARYQRMGYGRRAIGLLVEHVRTRPGASELLTSVVPGEGGPQPFYEGLGFAPTGEFDEGEAMLRLPL